jgi:WD40 repeat protein
MNFLIINYHVVAWLFTLKVRKKNHVTLLVFFIRTIFIRYIFWSNFFVGKLVGVGDLLSQVIIWDIDSGLIKHQTMVKKKRLDFLFGEKCCDSFSARFYLPFFKVGMSVRSLCWHPSGSSILIGCMDGSIFQWNFKENENGCEPEGEPTPIASLVGGKFGELIFFYCEFTFFFFWKFFEN